MMILKKASLLAAVGTVLVPAALYAADVDTRDVVHDARGNVVTSTNGNCVRTMWNSGSDECNPAPKAPVKQVFARLTKEQRTVYFDFNKSTLNAHEKAKLDDVSRILLSSKEVESVDIVGYADEIGTSGYNKKLSNRRSGAVRAYLAAKGLKTRNVRVEGLGESNSVTHCDKKMAKKALIACLAPDRRVEIEVNVKQ